MVGVAMALPFMPFLFYADVAVMNVTAEWIRPTSGQGIADLVGWVVFVVYLFVLIGLSAMVGGLIGAVIASTRKPSQ